jgi:hypothetical protein
VSDETGAWFSNREVFMRTPEEELFDEWLTTWPVPPPPPKRLHPIPHEIAPAFELQLDQFKRRLEDMQTKVEWKKHIQIYPNFIDRPQCNARADVYKSKGLIGLYKGLVLLPIDLFLRMFSHPSFLKGVGDTTNERWSPQHGEGVWNDFDVLIEKRKREGRPPLYPKPPVDPTRRRLAEVCADIVWRFLAFHEMVHILHGHLDYVYDTYATRFIANAARPMAMPISRQDLDVQALELWADAVAARGSLANLLRTSENTGAYSVVTDDRQKLFLWSLSLFTLFRLWGFEIDPMLLSGTHPPNPVRFALLADGGCDFTRLFPAIGDDDAYSNIVRQGQAAAEQGIAYCGGARLQYEHVKGIDDPLVAAHCNALLDHYHKILVPELTERAYIKVTYGSPPLSPAPSS